MSAFRLDGGVAAFLREAAEWRLLSLLLERPRGTWQADLGALAREVEAADLREAARAAERATEGFHLAFLGNGGPVSAREVGYRALSDPGRVLSELRAFYEAFAYRPESEEPLDHVACEAGFVGYLRLKQAFARARGDERAEWTAADAAQGFLAEHLAFVAGPLAERLESCDSGYLALAARALLARTGPRPARAGAWAAGSADDDSCQGCTLT